MKLATQRFTPENHAKITRAVMKAESQTSAEILPVVTNCSGRYDRAEDLVGLWLGLIFLTLTWVWFPQPDLDPQSWGGVPKIFSLLAYLVATVVGFVLGAWLGSQLDGLRALFTPRVQMQEDVWRRARSVFYDQRIHHTTGATGVLIYLSLLEHRAVILADQQVIEKLGQSQLDQLCVHLLERVQKGNLTEALCQTIEELGVLLAPVLPRQANDANELEDALIVLESI